MTTPQTHRLLSEGEIIQDGDEFGSGSIWTNCREMIGRAITRLHVGHYRRPLPARQHGETKCKTCGGHGSVLVSGTMLKNPVYGRCKDCQGGPAANTAQNDVSGSTATTETTAAQHGETPTPRTDAAEKEYEEYKAVCFEIEMGGGKTLPEAKPDGWAVARKLEAEICEQRQQWRMSTVCRGLRKDNDTAITALKAAYARGHYCDMGERCPGCIAGHALEQITGRKWTQEECG